MQCASCGCENLAGAKFCRECGARLELRCSQCGTELQASDKFCRECGHRVSTLHPPPSPTAPFLLPESFASGRYKVQRFLGEGAKKRVYLAHDTRLNRDVAVAVIKTEGLDEDGLTRVRREAEAMGRLGDHPNIVTIYDVAEERGQVYIVSQYMPGGDLEGLLLESENRRLPIDRALQIVSEVCRALEHGHARGIIHRDIKPGNIYLGEDGTAHLGDFGLAVALDRSRITQEGMLVGTAAYMAPEQAVGGEVTPRADIYAVGCVLYELLAGRPPFLGDDPVSVISQHLNTAPIAPTWHNPEIPLTLEALILDMLSKAPDDRPQTAPAVRQRLTDIMTMPSPPSPAVSMTTAVSQVAGAMRQLWGQFVGRTEELAQLRIGVDAALGGKASVMMLVGEPGIGKTRTAEELGTYARMRGAQVLWGRCHEGEGAPAYWPWIQVIRDYVHGHEAESLRSELGSGASDIAQVVSAVRERLPDLPHPAKLEPEQARFRLFDGITTFLHNASAHKPLVLIFDDLHWSDKSSLLLFQFLARQLRDSCLFILGTYRDVELDRKHPLAEVLSELRRERLYRRVLLSGFSIDEVVALLEAMAREELGARAGPLAQAIHRETEGNPFFVEEIILHLVESEAIYRDSTGQLVTRTQDMEELGIPEGVREVVGRRLSRLSDHCNEALTIAAVVGREFDQAVIEHVSELSGDELIGILEEAEQAGLISEMANLVGRYRFTHAIIRETLYEELSTPRRVRFHRQIAEVLESLHAAKPEPYLASLAYHFAEGARAGGEVEKAINYAVRAAEYATEQVAYEQAVAHYERALEVQELQQPRDDLLRCNLLLALGLAFVDAGDPPQAEEAFFKTIDIARILPAPEQLAEALRGAFEVRVEAGVPDEKILSLTEEALEVIPEGDSGIRAMLLARLAGALQYVEGSLERRTVLLEESLAMARRVGDKQAIMAALHSRCYIWELPAEKKIADATEYVNLAEELGLARASSWALFQQCNGYMLSGDVNAAKAVLDRLNTLEKKFSQPVMRFHLAVIEATLMLLAGRFDETERHVHEAFEHGQKVYRSLAIQFFQSFMWQLRRTQGRLDEWEARFSEELEAYADMDYYRSVVALESLTLGRREEARAEYDRLAADDFSNLTQTHYSDGLLSMMTTLACAFGDERRAAVLYDLLRPHGDRMLMSSTNTICHGAATHYLGMLAGTLRRWDDAIAHFEDALERNASIGSPPLVAQTQYEYAEVLLKRGDAKDRKKALGLVNKALETAHELGMKLLAEQALAVKLEVQELDSKAKRRAEPTKQSEEVSEIVVDVDPMTGKTISHYRILEKLGEGGMGVVYKAEDTKLKRTVALKFFTPQMLGTKEDRIRFTLEAQAAAALDHPNICTVHEIDEAEGKTFIAMAYVDGQSLHEKTESGPLEVTEAIDIAIKVAEGLRRAHRRGIIHRDIKSANVMVTDERQVKIMDFGLAKLKGRTRLTKTATIMGTVTYMSPEQASGEATVDHHTDIWSLGVLMYEMLSGKPPFDAPSDAGLIHKIIYEEPEPLNSVRTEIPFALEQIIKKAMQKDPLERYEDMEALIHDLELIRSGATPRIEIQEKTTPSIAVLPFADMSPHKDQEYFCDGISESIINELTQLSDLRVIARTSAFSFKGQNLDVREIGKKLNVGTVLEGSIQKAGDRVRVTAQLVNTIHGEHLWSQKYDRNIEDIFAVQDEITEAIVDKLKPKLLGTAKDRIAKRKTIDLEAYNLYLKGLWFLNRQGGVALEKAIDCFERTIEKAPKYAQAYASIALCYTLLPFVHSYSPKEAFPKAREAALKAVQLDDMSAGAHASLGIVLSNDFDWESADREIKTAIEVNPGSAISHQFYAYQLMRTCRFDEAVAEMKHTLELDPCSLQIHGHGIFVFCLARRVDLALETARHAFELDPDSGGVHYNLGFAYWYKGMYEEAVSEFKKEKERLGDFVSFTTEASLGLANATAGNMDEARQALESLAERSRQEYVPPYLIARLSFLVEGTDKGFEWLDLSYKEHDGWLCYLKADPFFEMFNLRSDSRYLALLEKIGLEK